MKVYFITRIPPSSPSAPAQRIKNYIRCIISAGYQCEILLKKQDRPVNIDDEIQGARSRCMMGYCPLHPSLKRKVFCLFSEIYTLLFLIFKLEKSDVVFLYEGRYFWSEMLIKVTHIKNAKILCDLCELPYGMSHETPKSISGRKNYENKVLSKVDGVIPISDALMDYAKLHTKNECVIVKVPILVDYEQYDIEDLSEFSDIPYIFHSGTLFEQKDGILGVIEAFGRALQKMDYPIRFISTGRMENSPEAKPIAEIIERYGISDNVVFAGYLTQGELKNYLQKASLVIINKSPNQQNKYCFSTKLGEYMAAGKAIIITKVGEAMNWLVNGDDALIIEPNDVSSLTDAIVTLFNNSEQRKRLGCSAKMHCKNKFDYKKWTHILKDILVELQK